LDRAPAGTEAFAFGGDQEAVGGGADPELTLLRTLYGATGYKGLRREEMEEEGTPKELREKISRLEQELARCRSEATRYGRFAAWASMALARELLNIVPRAGANQLARGLIDGSGGVVSLPEEFTVPLKAMAGQP
jgi:hypothetical protein